MSRRYASRRYAGGLGPSRIRTRIPTTRQLGQWVSLRKTLRFRVRLQLSQSRCLSLLLAMSSRVFLFFPPRGHEPPPTLRDRLNPNLSLYRQSVGQEKLRRARGVQIFLNTGKPLEYNHKGHVWTVDVRYCRILLLLYCTTTAVLYCTLLNMYHNAMRQNPSFYANKSYPYKTHVVCTTNDNK